MTEDSDRAEFGRLMRALVEADDVEVRAAAREALDAFHNRRAAEANAERASLAEAFGGDPIIGTRVVDGGTLQRPPAHTDVNSAFITLSDGRVMDKDELLARTRPPARRFSD